MPRCDHDIINNQMDTVLKRAGIQRTETLLFKVQNKKLLDDIKPLTETQVITLSETGVLSQNPADTDLQAQDTPMDQSPHLTHEETLLEKIRALEDEQKQSQVEQQSLMIELQYTRELNQAMHSEMKRVLELK